MRGRASVDSYLPDTEDSEMAPLNPATTTTVHDLYPIESQLHLVDPTSQYKVYKRRFFGLAVLVLLNIIVSWDVCYKSRRILHPHFADSKTVVDLFGRIKHCFPILSSVRKCHQLAQYWLSLRIRHCISVRYLNRLHQSCS
jgi:hypothetical protein